MSWNTAPDFEEVHAIFLEYGNVKSSIKIAETEIELETLEIKKNNPRKPWLIVEATQEKQTNLSKLIARKEELEQLVNWYNYWKEMFRSYGYNNR
jgi:hypothetical protein